MGFADNPAYIHRLSASKSSHITAVTLAPESMMGNSHSLGMLQKEVHALAQVELSVVELINWHCLRYNIT